MPYRELEPTPTITYATPDEAKRIIGHEDTRTKLAVTVINRETGQSQIIINSNLSEPIQQVLLQHESVQFKMIQEYSMKGAIENILPYAHYAGLDAGLDLAIKLGVAEEYLKLLGNGDTVESIRHGRLP